jgi:HPt (histidine-containing phosphotransfer) domain-containing protein
MNQPFTLNRTLILERLGNDEEIFAVMIDMYLQDLDTYTSSMAKALAVADAPLLQREAHTIKGLLATFADDAGTQAALAIEHQCKQGRLDGLEESIRAVNARLLEVAEVLKKEVA